MRSLLLLLVPALLVPLTLGGCSSNGTAAKKSDATVDDGGIHLGVVPACGDYDHTPTCPKPTPSYEKDIAPILAAKCGSCHTGPPAPWQLAPYEDLLHWRSQIQETLVACTMPPEDAGAFALSDAERGQLIGWIACGAPNN